MNQEHKNHLQIPKMATKKREFPLFSLLTFSLFLVLTQCYHPKTAATKQSLADLKRCELRCSMEEVHGTRRQSLCLAKCYDRDSQVAEKRVNDDQGNVTTNPYLFGKQRFKLRLKTEAGEFKVLQRFSKQSALLKGIDEYRLAVYEADPSTFLVPHHSDADMVFFVAGGEMTIGFVQHEKKESFDLKRGDAIRVPAGVAHYLVNRDISEKLRIFMLVHPVNVPGKFKAYFGVGGQGRGAYYRVFSNVWASAFNTTEDKLERFFGQKRELIVRASQEQIRALSQHGHQKTEHKGDKDEDFTNKKQKKEKEKPRDPTAPFSVLDQKHFFSNNYGQFFLASPDDVKQLEDLDASVAVMNIEPGAMVEPYFNSRSTIMVLVSQGNGSFEMACPHVSSHESQPQGLQPEEPGLIPREGEEEEQHKGTQYMKVASNFSAGDVFIIPAGHPISIASTGDRTLQLVGFGINARNNEKNFLAGQDNMWKNVEPEVKELSFGVPSMEVDELFGSQGLSYFVPVSGQQKSQQGEGCEESGGGTGFSLPSLLDFVGFM